MASCLEFYVTCLVGFATTAESCRLKYNRTSLSVGLVAEFSSAGSALFSFIEITRVKFLEE